MSIKETKQHPMILENWLWSDIRLFFKHLKVLPKNFCNIMQRNLKYLRKLRFSVKHWNLKYLRKLRISVKTEKGRSGQYN